MRLICKVLLIFSSVVLSECRCLRSFEATDCCVRNSVKILVKSYEDDISDFSVNNVYSRSTTTKSVKKNNYTYEIIFTMPVIQDSEIGNKNTLTFNFEDKNGERYQAVLTYTARYKLISPSKGCIVEYVLEEVICDKTKKCELKNRKIIDINDECEDILIFI